MINIASASDACRCACVRVGVGHARSAGEVEGRLKPLLEKLGYADGQLPVPKSRPWEITSMLSRSGNFSSCRVPPADPRRETS